MVSGYIEWEEDYHPNFINQEPPRSLKSYHVITLTDEEYAMVCKMNELIGQVETLLKTKQAENIESSLILAKEPHGNPNGR